MSVRAFINRELSWLHFNRRVLEEAENQQPSAARAGALPVDLGQQSRRILHGARRRPARARCATGIVDKSPDGLTPAEQLVRIGEAVGSLASDQQARWRELREELRKRRTSCWSTADSLTKAEKAWLEDHFLQHIFPVLTPLAIDPAHPFPFIPNLGFTIALQLARASDGKAMNALIRVPQQDRALHPPARRRTSGGRALDHARAGDRPVHRQAVPRLRGQGAGRASASSATSDIEVEEEAEDLVRLFETRAEAPPPRLGDPARNRSGDAGRSCARFVQRALGVADDEVFLVDGVLALNELSQLVALDRPDLKFVPYNPRFPERIRDHGGDCFAAIRQKDLIVHHPYESFDVVVQFLQSGGARSGRGRDQADALPHLQRIRRSCSALVEAAEAGKSVTALVELKARFDEEANIRWARDLERAGVQVVYGFIELKTHAKLSLVVRREGGALAPTCMSAPATIIR